jgi:hypothetical protein
VSWSNCTVASEEVEEEPLNCLWPYWVVFEVPIDGNKSSDAGDCCIGNTTP